MTWVYLTPFPLYKSSETRFIVQLFVRLELADVITIKQPVDLLARQRNDLIICRGPVEFLFRQRLVVQHEAIVFPQQTLDLVTAAIGKGVQVARKHVVTELQLHQCGQTPITLAVMRCSA